MTMFHLLGREGSRALLKCLDCPKFDPYCDTLLDQAFSNKKGAAFAKEDSLQTLKSVVPFVATQDGLRNLMYLFVRRLSDGLEDIVKDLGRSKKALAVLRDFWALCCLQLKVLPPPRMNSERDMELIMVIPSLASLYLDLAVAAQGNDKLKRKAVARDLQSVLTLDLNPRCIKTALLEMSQCNTRGAKLLMPLLRKVLLCALPEPVDALEYLQTVLALRRWTLVSEKFTQRSQMVNPLRAPQGFVTWLSQHWTGLRDHFPQDKSLKGRRVTEVMLSLDQQVVDALIDMFSDCLWSDQTKSQSESKPAATALEAMETDEAPQLFVIDKFGSNMSFMDDPIEPSKKRRRRGLSNSSDKDNEGEQLVPDVLGFEGQSEAMEVEEEAGSEEEEDDDEEKNQKEEDSDKETDDDEDDNSNEDVEDDDNNGVKEDDSHDRSGDNEEDDGDSGAQSDEEADDNDDDTAGVQDGDKDDGGGDTPDESSDDAAGDDNNDDDASDDDDDDDDSNAEILGSDDNTVYQYHDTRQKRVNQQPRQEQFDGMQVIVYDHQATDPVSQTLKALRHSVTSSPVTRSKVTDENPSSSTSVRKYSRRSAADFFDSEDDSFTKLSSKRSPSPTKMVSPFEKNSPSLLLSNQTSTTSSPKRKSPQVKSATPSQASPRGRAAKTLEDNDEVSLENTLDASTLKSPTKKKEKSSTPKTRRDAYYLRNIAADYRRTIEDERSETTGNEFTTLKRKISQPETKAASPKKSPSNRRKSLRSASTKAS